MSQQQCGVVGEWVVGWLVDHHFSPLAENADVHQTEMLCRHVSSTCAPPARPRRPACSARGGKWCQDGARRGGRCPGGGVWVVGGWVRGWVGKFELGWSLPARTYGTWPLSLLRERCRGGFCSQYEVLRPPPLHPTATKGGQTPTSPTPQASWTAAWAWFRLRCWLLGSQMTKQNQGLVHLGVHQLQGTHGLEEGENRQGDHFPRAQGTGGVPAFLVLCGVVLGGWVGGWVGLMGNSIHACGGGLTWVMSFHPPLRVPPPASSSAGDGLSVSISFPAALCGGGCVWVCGGVVVG